MLVLPHTDRRQAEELCQRVLQEIRMLEFDGLDGQSVSGSIGVAISDQEPTPKTVHELISNADTALYKAKHSGRDRAVFF